MQRRQLMVTACGVATVGIAGCLGDDQDLRGADYDPPDDGERGGTNDNGYATYVVGDQAVPLAPTDQVSEWYEHDEDLVVVDTRSRDEYDSLHIEGAVWSPHPDGRETNDPLADVDTDTLIVTYCVCPHAMAGSRAASLMDDGYTEVYALDEGLQEWVDRGLPTSP